MLMTQAPFIQGKNYYPDMTTCNNVAQRISASSMGLYANCKYTHIPRSNLPGGIEVPAFILVTNAPFRGMQAFYPDVISCQAIARSVRDTATHPKSACYPVRIPSGYLKQKNQKPF